MSLIQLGNNNVINMNSASFSVRESAVQAARVSEKKNTISQLQELQLANIVSRDHKELITENLDLRKEEDRKKSFINWSVENLTVTPEFLAKSGFFYLGNLDRVQCFSCAGVLRNWRSGDDVDTEHKRHFPHCKMVMKTETRNVPLVRNKVAPILEMIEPPNPLPEDVPHLEAQFPCANPVNPHMRSETMRFDTFDTRWPKDKVKATPIQIAKAGFYFLVTGERDRAKCWYCNGGLHNLDYNDEPWTEHAKWFPGCEFILRQKGVAFVKNTFRKFPNLPRPTLRNSRFDAQTGEIIYRSAPLPLRSVTTVIDPRRTMSAGMVLSSSPPIRPPMVQADETLSFSSRDQHMMRDVENMGFDRKKIERLVKQRIDDTSRGFASIEQLVEAVLHAPEDEAANDDINSDEERTDLSIDETGSERNEEINVPSLKISLKRKDNYDVGKQKKEVQSDTRSSKMLKSGERDRAKCWYCNGGLQNWDYNDEPWTEHAKWFPECGFLSHEKRVAVENNTSREFSNLSRSTLRNSGFDVQIGDFIYPKIMLDPRYAMSAGDQKMMHDVENMGFDGKKIKRLVVRHIDCTGKGFMNTEELVEAVLHAPDNESANDDVYSAEDWAVSSMEETGSEENPKSNTSSRNMSLKRKKDLNTVYVKGSGEISPDTKPSKISKSNFNCSSETYEIESDGRVLHKQNDSTDQRGSYILPRDAYKESFRLSTFLKFPENAPVNECLLAERGFLYTGYKDRVKCFSCNAQVQDWKYHEDPTLAKWHHRACQMMLGDDQRNQPIQTEVISYIKENKFSPANDDGSPSCSYKNSSGIGGSNGLGSADMPTHHGGLIVKNLDFKKEKDRKKSFTNWSKKIQTATPATLAKSGFFYLGNLDRVQCFSCSGVLRNWRCSDDVDIEHQRHFPHCKMSLKCETRNVPISGNLRRTQRDQHRVYILPGNNYRETYRLSTFKNFPLTAPVNQRELAAHGFFYTGYEDRVNCFSCGSQVEDWKQGDNPAQKKWHQRDCSLVLGTDKLNQIIGNRCIQFYGDHIKPHRLLDLKLANIESRDHRELITKNLDLRKEEDRKKSFTNWPRENSKVTRVTLAKSGFFYLGNLDRVQCFSCFGVLRNWRCDDDVDAEHQRYFPHCKMVLHTEINNVPLTTTFATTNVSQTEMPEPCNPSHQDIDPLERQLLFSNTTNLHDAYNCNASVIPISP